MAKDVQEVARDLFSRAIESATSNGGGRSKRGGSNGLSGMRGMAAGAGAAALVPAAVKAVRSGSIKSVAKSPAKAAGGLTSRLGDQVGGGIGEKVSEKVDEAGGPSGILKNTVTDALPFGGGSGGGSKGGAAGVGKGRRMPVQQSVDIGIPLETVYNQWTQFEDWPNFMHRVTRVTQEDDCTVSFAAKIWGKTKEFTAEIETQRPEQRIKWRVSQGLTHQGVVTFHELGPNLTRILLGMDVEPGGLLEKAARGMRHVKRAARADLHRFKAFIEMNEQESGAWRGVIEDGEVVEEHDPGYDEDREYADIEELTSEGEEDGDEEDEDQGEPEDAAGDAEDDAEEEEPEDEQDEAPARSRRRSRASSGDGGRAASSGSGRSRGQTSSRSGASRRSSDGRSGSRRTRARDSQSS